MVRSKHFDTENGLSGHRVLSFLQDREGGLWVVTPDGVDYFRDYTATSFAPDNQVFDDRARAVAARGDDLYQGSDSLVQLHSGQIHCVRDEHGEPLHDVQFLFSDSANNRWIGAGNRLLVLGIRGKIAEVMNALAPNPVGGFGLAVRSMASSGFMTADLSGCFRAALTIALRTYYRNRTAPSGSLHQGDSSGMRMVKLSCLALLMGCPVTAQ
jgi:Two component regulator propeller